MGFNPSPALPEPPASLATPAAAAAGADVLIIVAHPQLEQSRVNRRLMQAAATAALAGNDASPKILIRDLYAIYPDYLIDVAAEQAALASARLIVWQHPIHWYSMPPLMKLWVDEVLAFGWAYGPEGAALRRKDLWLVTTTGGPEQSYHPSSYNRYFFDAFMPPYEQTAALCGMRFLPPLVLHGAHKTSEAELREHAMLYAERLTHYPNWDEIESLPDCVACTVPLTARPLENFAESA